MWVCPCEIWHITGFFAAVSSALPCLPPFLLLCIPALLPCLFLLPSSILSLPPQPASSLPPLFFCHLLPWVPYISYLILISPLPLMLWHILVILSLFCGVGLLHCPHSPTCFSSVPTTSTTSLTPFPLSAHSLAAAVILPPPPSQRCAGERERGRGNSREIVDVRCCIESALSLSCGQMEDGAAATSFPLLAERHFLFHSQCLLIQPFPYANAGLDVWWIKREKGLRTWNRGDAKRPRRCLE